MKKNLLCIFTLIALTLAYSCDFFEKEKKDTQQKKVDQKTTEKVKEEPKAEVVVNTKPAFGVDISAYQGNEVDALDKSKDSLDFIICKATQGATFIDPMFKSNWKNIKEKGFIRGAYHFYNSRDNPIAQAQFFVSMIKDIKPTDLPPIIDVEEGGIDKGQSVDQIQLSILTLLKEVEKMLNVKPIIYTDTNFGDKYLNNPEFANYPLWIADYESEKEPKLPNTWKEKGYILWQKSDTYKIKGFTNDEDYFNGDLESLKAFIKESRQ